MKSITEFAFICLIISISFKSRAIWTAPTFQSDAGAANTDGLQELKANGEGSSKNDSHSEDRKLSQKQLYAMHKYGAYAETRRPYFL